MAAARLGNDFSFNNPNFAAMGEIGAISEILKKRQNTFFFSISALHITDPPCPQCWSLRVPESPPVSWWESVSTWRLAVAVVAWSQS